MGSTGWGYLAWFSVRDGGGTVGTMGGNGDNGRQWGTQRPVRTPAEVGQEQPLQPFVASHQVLVQIYPRLSLFP